MKEERRVGGVRQRQLEPLLTAKEVADLLHVHVSSVGRWSRAGKLKFYRVGFRGDMRFQRKDVTDFMEESKQFRAPLHSKYPQS
jgi:excisionase family DNA binding protein